MSANREVSQDTVALYDAADRGDLKAVEKLLRKGANNADAKIDLNWHKREEYGATSLTTAIEKNHTDVAKILIDAGADVAVMKTPDLNTPLHLACLTKRPKVVEYLLEKKDGVTTQGVDHHPWNMIEAINQYGNTPLHLAAMAGCKSCVELLVNAGANIHTTNSDKSTVLHYACYCDDDNSETIDYLVAQGVEVNSKDQFGSTPLMVAAKKNQTKGVSVLLKHGADKSLLDSHEKDALYYAKQRNHKEITNLLE